MRRILSIVIIILTGLLFYNVSLPAGEEPTNKEISGQKNKSDTLYLDNPVRIGYFHGGRIHLLWRAYISKYFDDEGVNVEFYSKYLGKEGLYKVPKNFGEMQEKMGTDDEAAYFGKQTGTEIIEAMERGILDGGTVGEFTFVQAVSNNSPIVAVAELGQETAEMPAKAIAMRKDVVINSPEDFKGKTLIASRPRSIDAIILREFIESLGLDAEQDLSIIYQARHDKQEELLKKKKIHGGLFHLHRLASFVKKDLIYIYRKMDWLNPEISHSLLVFRKEFVETYPEAVKKIILAYMKRIKYEHNIPPKEKVKEKRFGLQMVLYFQDMNLPQYDYPPLVSQDLLKEVQSLSLKYRFIDKQVDLTKFINNRFVKEVYGELK
jgi:ABC-type nitrate/sulfonate/bicarbonate transport system substrate-binding protein